jgi:hypothetical protein
MKITLTSPKPIKGYWDGGEKNTFCFEIESQLFPKEDLIKWGSWEANHWFYTKKGKTDKLSLSYAIKHLKKSILKNNFEIKTEI